MGERCSGGSIHMSKKLYIFLSFLSLSLSSWANDPAPTSIQVHGHRGARARLPENTLPAFEYALNLGVDYLELDLAVTRDGVLVVSHDPHINPILCVDANGKKFPEGKEPLIHDLTLQQVQSYDCGSIQNPRFPKQETKKGTSIPTLEQVFETVKKSTLAHAKKVRFNIETKIFPDHPEYTVGPLEFAKKVIALLKKHGMLDRSVLQSFDYRTLIAAKKLEPRLKISALTETAQEDLEKTARDLKPDFISPLWTLINAEKVSKLHALGVKLAPWTANEPSEWNQLIAWKVDAIITDDPEGLIDYLKMNRQPAK